MTSEFYPLNALDTKKLRKEIGLPVTKNLVYWGRNDEHIWMQWAVIDYKIVDTYMPSGTKSLMIMLENGRQIRILADYFAEMQRSSFLYDVGGVIEKTQDVTGKMGRRIDEKVNSYIVVDLETTGTNHFNDEITEIGAIKYIAGKEKDRFNILIKTKKKIPAQIERLTGITNEMLQNDGIDPKDAYTQFKDFVDDSVIVGHNFTTFDSKFLDDAYVQEFGCHFPNDYIDTLYLARKTLPGLDHYSLECLAQKYDVDYSAAHHAINDCIINHKVYEYLAFGCLLSNEAVNELLDHCDDKHTSAMASNEELVEINVSEDWQKKIVKSFPELEQRFGLMKSSFSIMANIGKDKKVSSYAVCVYEPDLVEDRKDSSRNTVLVRIKEDVLKSNANIVDVSSKSFENSDEKRRMEKNSKEFIDCVIDCVCFGIENYVPKASKFACCSRYQECSNVKKCIHPNKLYAKACQYRKNLEEGNIFY